MRDTPFFSMGTMVQSANSFSLQFYRGKEEEAWRKGVERN
jgi:hypothetical protein